MSARSSARVGGLPRGLFALVSSLLAVGCGEAFQVGDGAGGAATTASSTSAGGASSTSGAGGAAGSTTTASATSTGTDATSTSTGAPTEDCTNGGDDDSDALVDCEDPDCGAFACVEAAPMDWVGPGAFYLGSPATVPSCNAPWAQSTLFGGGNLDAPGAACSCSCSTPQGTLCTQPAVTTYGDQSCLASLLQLPVGAPGQCTNVVNGVTVSGSLLAPASQPVGGSCNPVPTTDIVDATFQFKAVFCGGAPLGGGCDAGQVCAPIPEPSFETGLCVYRYGDFACPEGTYVASSTVYDGIVDTRDCSACTCDAPKGVQCSGKTRFYSDMVCSNEVLSLDHDGNCKGANAAFLSLSYEQQGPSNGSCVPNGGVADGKAAPGTNVTVCCKP